MITSSWLRNRSRRRRRIRLEMELATYNRVYLVVDAFDEYKFRGKLLQDILNLGGRNLSLPITSRQEGGRPRVINCDTRLVKNLRIYYSCKLCNEGDFDACQVCGVKDVTCGDASHPELPGPSRVDIDIVAPEYDYVTEGLDTQIGYRSLAYVH